MVDVRSRRCRCGASVARFGWPNHAPVCCRKCRVGTMVNLRLKRCQCGRASPVYGIANGKAQCCRRCRDPNMINVRAKKCRVCSSTVATFAAQASATATHCARCRDMTMVRRSGWLCACGVTAYFGTEGHRPTHCKRCRSPGMQDVRSPRCSCPEKRRPHFGAPGAARATHCTACREADHVVVTGHWCSGSCHVVDEAAPARFLVGGEWLCWACSKDRIGALGQNVCRAIRREYLFLGELVTRCLPAELGLPPGSPLYAYQHDRAVLSCHSICRPDLTFVLPNFLIVVEFDEGGHANRSSLSEMRHLEVIRRWALQKHGLRYMYVLRIDERGLFRRTSTGAHTGVQRQPREMVWQPTKLFHACVHDVTMRLVCCFRQALCPSGTIPEHLRTAPQGTWVETWVAHNMKS